MRARGLNAVTLRGVLGQWSAGGPAYRDLAGALRQLILDGRVPLETRLPGERELAAALGVSRTTVTAAYAALRDEGFVVTRHGTRGTTALPAGTSVLTLPFGAAPTSGEPLDPLLDLAYATLPAPGGVLHQAYMAALQALPAHLPTHGYDPLGLPVLRAALARRYTGRGLATDAEQIMVTFGAQHALGLLVQVLLSPGDRVLVDHPTYLYALDAFRQAGCRLVPVALNEGGWDVEALRAAMRQTSPRLAYLIPDFHNPTGHCMSPQQRRATLRAAHESRTTVIVDETSVDLALDGPIPPPSALHDRWGEVVSIGTLSKSVWGGLRIGWVRAPRTLIARLASARSALDLGTPVLEQLAAAHLLAGEAPILAARHDLLKRQRAALLEELAAQLPDWRYHVPEGGLSLWATLPRPVSSVLAGVGERYGVRVLAGAHFGTEGGLFERHLRVPFTLPEPALREAVARLARAYRAVTGWTPPAPVNPPLYPRGV